MKLAWDQYAMCSSQICRWLSSSLTAATHPYYAFLHTLIAALKQLPTLPRHFNNWGSPGQPPPAMREGTSDDLNLNQQYDSDASAKSNKQ
jgi:hypothetical protein